MNIKPVGLLWDSVSNNTGDIAIGMVLQKFCESNHIDFGIADPFSYNPTDFSTFIIGGGQLLRGEDDLFYQNFRVPGHHILNTVGIHHPRNLGYLHDYRLVSVRSDAEKAQIENIEPNLDVEVCPCITIQFEKYFKDELAAVDIGGDRNQEKIGIHLNNTTLRRLPDLFDALQQINKKYPIHFIPFTHYENDRYLMETLAKWLPNATVSTADDPVALFSEIGKLRAMISSSMHASIFAYIQKVPVLAYPQDSKLRYFFEERSIPVSLYESALSLSSQLDELLKNPPDYSDSIKNDKKIVDNHLEKIAGLLESPIEQPNYASEFTRDDRYNRLHRDFYQLHMQRIYELNTLNTQIIDLRMQNAQTRNSHSPVARLQRVLTRQPLSGKKEDGGFRTLVKRTLSGTSQQDYRLVASSTLFNKAWYLEHNPDVAMSKMDPIKHYLKFGAQEGRDPGPEFSTKGYLERNPQLKNSSQNPLVHYLREIRLEK